MLAQNSTTREPSPQSSDTKEHKRRRKALACYPCRRRKLKCDRISPACGRCVKGRVSDTCTYSSNDADNLLIEKPDEQFGEVVHPLALGSSAINGTRSTVARHHPDDVLFKIRQQEERILQLQNRVTHLERASGELSDDFGKGGWAGAPGDALGGATSGKEGEPSSRPEMMMLRGKNYKTQFYGASHPSGLIQFVSLLVS